MAAPDASAVDSVPLVSAVDSATASKVVNVATTLRRKVDDFLFGLKGYKVVDVSPGKLIELATNDAEELLNDKKTRCQTVLGKPRVPTIYEDTKVSFVNEEGTDLLWPSYDVTRLSSKQLKKNLYEWATFLGCTRAKLCCSAIMEMADGRSFFFTVTCEVTMCERRPGEGAIDPFTIPDGSDKAFSEMSEEERAIFHPRAELARLIAAKLHELGY
jgi:inosine/xanthosine triphosphate pyrophosphatase family protein